MTLPPIFLLRHGQTEWNLEGRLQGRKDSALTDKGRTQALMQRDILAPILKSHPDMSIHASPLGRAFETAKLASDGRMVHPVEGLIEVSAGSWEGRLRADVVKEQGFGSADEKDMFDLFLSAPDGEGAEALEARVSRYLSQLSVPTVVVSHGVTSAVLRGLACGLNRDEFANLPHHQGVVTLLRGGKAEILKTAEEASQVLHLV